MAFKFDKQMILKHRFWVMLGVSVTLTLLGIIILELSEASGRDKLKNELKANGAFQAKENQATINNIKEKAELAKKAENAVWQAAYKPQADLYHWPDDVEKHYDFANGYFANEVKIIKLADPNPKKWEEAAKNWPADTPFLMHGAYVTQQQDWVKIKDRKGEIQKFFVTRRSEKILTDDGKQVGFDEMDKHAAKKLLAVGYQRGKYFGDPLTASERSLFKLSYASQIGPILESVDPLDDKSNGVVQLNGWLYKKDTLPHETGANAGFMRYVGQKWTEKATDIDKDAWMAQEDLWIQKEIFRMIKSANDSVSSFTPLGPLPLPAKPAPFTGKPEKRNQAYAFQNSYFDLELTLDESDNLSFKIKNRLPRKQSIDLSFRVLLNGAKGHKEELIKLSGLPLYPAGTKGQDSFTQTLAKEKDERTGVYSVQQVLNWQTAAIKRIDQISVGGDTSLSQRAANVPLRPLEGEAVVKPPVGIVIPPKGRPLPGKPGILPKKGPPIAVAPVGGGMGMRPDRYIEVTEQARRLPVAVVLIVDQDHVDRVLTAFNNSKLRFLETQVLLNQYAGSLQPPVAEEKDAAPVPVFRPIFGPKGGLPIPARPAENAGGADLETNMELVIYGIVTLYQRYPARPVMAPLENKQ